MEYLEGRVFENTSLPGHDTEDRKAIYNSMNETLAALHKVKPEEIGLENFGRPGSYFVRQLKRWSQQWELSKQQDIPEMPLLIDWLSKNIPESDETTIVHGDYRLGNLIYDLNEPKVIAVLDWELSTLGHPLADLGYNLMLHEEDSDVRSGFSLKNLDLVKLGIPTKDYLVKKYCEITDDPKEADYIIVQLRTVFNGNQPSGIDRPIDNFLSTIFPNNDLNYDDKILSKLKKYSSLSKLITVVDLNRPAILTEIEKISHGLIGVFGVFDEVVLEIIFGNFNPTGKLPFDIPSSMKEVNDQLSDVPDDTKNPIFRYGHGLSYLKK